MLLWLSQSNIGDVDTFFPLLFKHKLPIGLCIFVHYKLSFSFSITMCVCVVTGIMAFYLSDWCEWEELAQVQG